MAEGDGTKGKRGSKASQKEPATKPATGKAGLVKRGRDELDFLGSRAKATPLDAATVRAHLQGIHTRIEASKRGRGREAHESGTLLNTVYMRHGDASLGFLSFRKLLIAHWPDRLDDAYGFMLVARRCTALQCETHGYWKALYGIRLADKLELADFDALEAREFAIDADGLPVTFARMTIEEVRARSTPAALEAATESEPSGRAVLRLRGRAQKLQSEHVEYQALGIRIFVADGAPSVSVTSSRKEGAEAARRFLAELWK